MTDWPDDRSPGVPAAAQVLVGQIPIGLGMSGTLTADDTTTFIYNIPNNGYYYRLAAVYGIMYTSWPSRVEIYYNQPIGGANLYVHGGLCYKNINYIPRIEQVIPLYYGDRYVILLRNYDKRDCLYVLYLSIFQYLGD